jgi:hypothetical protein
MDFKSKLLLLHPPSYAVVYSFLSFFYILFLCFIFLFIYLYFHVKNI